MKKGKFLFIENTKDEKAEYQIFDNNQEYDEEQQKKLLKQEMICLPEETYVIINKFIIK